MLLYQQVVQCIDHVLRWINFDKMLKDKQKEAIHKFVRGRDFANEVLENIVLYLAAIRVRPFRKEQLGLLL